MLEAKTFSIFTDHKPPVFAFQQRNEKASPRQLRHLDYISRFSTDIQHISGKDNIVADTLSRIHNISSITFASAFNYNFLAQEQESDEQLRLLQKRNTGLKLFNHEVDSLFGDEEFVRS